MWSLIGGVWEVIECDLGCLWFFCNFVFYDDIFLILSFVCLKGNCGIVRVLFYIWCNFGGI